MSMLLLSSDTPEEGIRSHYKWLWATMRLLGIELRTSGKAVSILNHWAISPALDAVSMAYMPSLASCFSIMTSLCDHRDYDTLCFSPIASSYGFFHGLVLVLSMNKNCVSCVSITPSYFFLSFGSCIPGSPHIWYRADPPVYQSYLVSVSWDSIQRPEYDVE
jgi:hypothetical protein